jgi:calcineurin-like phosphoesterase family protein
MALFLTADLHIFHDAIVRHCQRPFPNAVGMWRTIKRNWNNAVGPEDTTWILGDLTMKGRDFKASLAKMMANLNGHKHLIYGNHDQMLPRDYSDVGILTTHYPMFHLQPQNWFLCHDPALANVLADGDILLCGHVHNNFKTATTLTGVRMVNVGVDVWDFTPVSEEQIRDIL